MKLPFFPQHLTEYFVMTEAWQEIQSGLLESCVFSSPRLLFLYLGYETYFQIISLSRPIDVFC